MAKLTYEMITCKMLKPWGGYDVGDIVKIGEPKAESLAQQGYLVFNWPIKAQPVETAEVRPVAETAERKPVKQPKRKQGK